ncbi:hydroxymethylpyrimidine/phosphomethylpyrimidine kinase [Mesorhizobium sp. M0622]
MLSSAVAASLALGASLDASVSRAKQQVFDALAESKDRAES